MILAGLTASETVRQLIRDWTNTHKQRGTKVNENDELAEPTNEYAMRHAANLLSSTFGYGTTNAATMNAGDLEVINYAYQQLHRGANTLRAAQAKDAK